jgi:hypothetical protein
MPGVVTGSGELNAVIGAGVTAIGEGEACGCGVCAATVGAALGFGAGAAVGGGLIATATTAAVGTVVGTCAGRGAGETAITASVGMGFGASELSGAGVGFGGAVGANFASSCRTGGCGGAERGCDAARGCGTTLACGIGCAIFTAGAGALEGRGSELTVMMTPPETDSGDCSDDDVATENKNIAISACTIAEARKLTAVRSGR